MDETTIRGIIREEIAASLGRMLSAADDRCLDHGCNNAYSSVTVAAEDVRDLLYDEVSRLS